MSSVDIESIAWTATWIRLGVGSKSSGETKSLGARGVVERPGAVGVEGGNWSRNRLFKPGAGERGGKVVSRAGGRIVLSTEDRMSLPS